MKFRSVAGLTVLVYALSSPPFAAAIAQLALAPFGDSNPDPDPVHAAPSDAIPSSVETGRLFPVLPGRGTARESFFAEPGGGACETGVASESRDYRDPRELEFERVEADSSGSLDLRSLDSQGR